MAKRQVATKQPEGKRWVSVLILIFIGLTFFLAQSVTWLNHTVLSQSFFTQTINSELAEEPNRQAIAETVVAKAFEDRPIIQKVAGDQAVMFVSAILGSDVSQRVINGVVERGYSFLTRPNREDVVIDLSAIQRPVAALVTIAQNQFDGERLDAIDPGSIPTEIVLIEEDKWPDYSGLVRTALWMEPLLWMAFVGLAVLYIYLGRRTYAGKVYALAFTLIGVTLFAMIMGPFLPPSLATLAASVTMGTVIQNISEAFLAPFLRQLTVTLIILVLALIIFRYRDALAHAFQTLREKVTQRKA